MIGMDRCNGNLYVFDLANLFPTLAHTSGPCNNVSKTDHELWHTRLGHLSDVRLNLLKNILNFKHNVDSSPHYSICHLAKQKQLAFPISNSVSQCLFDLLHIDIWGTFYLATHNGFRYFLTIVNDYSRFTWVYLLKSKFNVNSIFHAFYTLIHTQFRANINQFIVIMHPNLLFLDYFCKKGIFPFHSCVDTPQQNFAVERKHQTPFECGPSIIVSIQYSSILLG